MSYIAALIDGTLVEIVDKVPGQARGSELVDAEGNRYVASKHGDYITPVEVAEAVAEAVAEEVPGAEELPEVPAEPVDETEGTEEPTEEEEEVSEES